MATDKTKTNALEKLEKLEEAGVTFVVLGFSGGHDEGYCDRVELYGAQLEDVELNDDPQARLYQLMRTHKQVPEKTEGGVDLLDGINVLEFPIWDNYGSFAGDFSVYGHVYWDVKARLATLMAEETAWVDRPVVTMSLLGDDAGADR